MICKSKILTTNNEVRHLRITVSDDYPSTILRIEGTDFDRDDKFDTLIISEGVSRNVNVSEIGPNVLGETNDSSINNLLNHSIETLIICEGILKIRENAFQGANIENVSIPSSCKKIGYRSFSESTLKSVDKEYCFSV